MMDATFRSFFEIRQQNIIATVIKKLHLCWEDRMLTAKALALAGKKKLCSKSCYSAGYFGLQITL
jgi:hypothetical protein